MRSTARLALSSVVALVSILLAAAPASADEPDAGSAPAAPTPPAASAGAPAAPGDTPVPSTTPQAAPTQAATPQAPPPSTPALPPPAPVAPPPSSGAAASSATAERAGHDTPADAPADAPKKEGDTRRAEGLRLALDLGFQRAFDGAQDRLNAGSPTLLPLGVDVSMRTSASLLVGLHGYAALASRDDCVSDVDSCRARAYGFGAHVEAPLSKTATSFVPWIRYGVTYEILYQGGAALDAEGHVYRGAFDIVDLRIGGDFIVARGSNGKTARIGGYLGLVGGFLVNQTGVTHRNGSGGQPRDLDRDSGSAHLWFTGGLRATLDP